MLFGAAQFLAEIIISALIEHVLAGQIAEKKVQRAVAEALKKALESTISVFPSVSIAFDDLEFLKRERVVTEIRKLVHPTEQPNLDMLVQEWVAQFPSTLIGDPRLVLSKFLAASISQLRHIPEVASILHHKETTEHARTTE